MEMAVLMDAKAHSITFILSVGCLLDGHERWNNFTILPCCVASQSYDDSSEKK